MATADLVIEITRIRIEKATTDSGRRGAQLRELIPPANDVSNLGTTRFDGDNYNFDIDYFNMTVIASVLRASWL